MSKIHSSTQQMFPGQGWSVYTTGAGTYSSYTPSQNHPGSASSDPRQMAQNAHYAASSSTMNPLRDGHRVPRGYSMVAVDPNRSYAYRDSVFSQTDSFTASSFLSTDSFQSDEESSPDTPSGGTPPTPISHPVPLPPASEAESDTTLRGDEGSMQPHSSNRYGMIIPDQTRVFIARSAGDDGSSYARGPLLERQLSNAGPSRPSPPRFNFPPMAPSSIMHRTLSKSRDTSPPRARPTMVPVRRGSADENDIHPRPSLPSRSNSAPPNVLRKLPPGRREGAGNQFVVVPPMPPMTEPPRRPLPTVPQQSSMPASMPGRERRPSLSGPSPNTLPMPNAPGAPVSVPGRERRPSVSGPAPNPMPMPNAQGVPVSIPGRERRPSFSMPTPPIAVPPPQGSVVNVPPRERRPSFSNGRPEAQRHLSDTAVEITQQQRVLDAAAAQRPETRRSQSDPLPVGAAYHGQAHSAAAGRSVRWKEELICPSPLLHQRRKGWWNKRGDQLWTNDGGYRGPLPGEEYPLDLAEYPDVGEGWMNEDGMRIDMSHRLIPKLPARSALKRRA
ncbi:hypothetical protein PUNSTDRAFT_126220 [Punctularia strigosozonata HHB-11173 SS5]|uniref:uncharacterized protein n=1 Tax=Punctularia strigosozonata (strain HHB-11173) TaxID=741275 RepID=UPI0004416B55|nr:uncharacterized protein PUNSTDRAFT_126220 [Punctularia strigosozonata HHB-11173 SS5]EIN09097.1 hypothetical protein PUNSTDRAFT_126220 [Punctularia strigosozonata HHB-11173 SS5]